MLILRNGFFDGVKNRLFSLRFLESLLGQGFGVLNLLLLVIIGVSLIDLSAWLNLIFLVNLFESKWLSSFEVSKKIHNILR